MNAAIQYVRKLALAFLILGSIAVSQVASAASIELNIWLKNYGFVQVRPKAAYNTGGKIAWDPARWCWYTDRVNRNERLYVFVWPTAGEATGPNTAYYGIWCDSQSRYLVGPKWALWADSCWYFEYVVPTDPTKDNLAVDFFTNIGSPTPGFATKRIPIGYRNP